MIILKNVILYRERLYLKQVFKYYFIIHCSFLIIEF